MKKEKIVLPPPNNNEDIYSKDEWKFDVLIIVAGVILLLSVLGVGMIIYGAI